MIRLRYYLHVDVDESLIPGDVIHEIHSTAEPQDRDWSQMVRRYIGGDLDTASNALADVLPEGFSVRVDDVPTVDQVSL